MLKPIFVSAGVECSVNVSQATLRLLVNLEASDLEAAVDIVSQEKKVKRK